MFKKILVPVDGSKHSIMAAVRAVDIAEKYHGSVTLLHVINISQLTGLGSMQDPPLISEAIVNNLKEAGQTIIDDTVKQLPPSKVEISTATVWGTPERVIINEITARGYDLVVMGSRGLGTFSGLLLGSVSDRVLRQASCPVLIVK